MRKDVTKPGYTLWDVTASRHTISPDLEDVAASGKDVTASGHTKVIDSEDVTTSGSNLNTRGVNECSYLYKNCKGREPGARMSRAGGLHSSCHHPCVINLAKLTFCPEPSTFTIFHYFNGTSVVNFSAHRSISTRVVKEENLDARMSREGGRHSSCHQELWHDRLK